MPRSAFFVAFAALAVAVVILARGTPASARARTARSPVERDECAVSECGADGVPLSLYAG